MLYDFLMVWQPELRCVIPKLIEYSDGISLESPKWIWRWFKLSIWKFNIHNPMRFNPIWKHFNIQFQIILEFLIIFRKTNHHFEFRYQNVIWCVAIPFGLQINNFIPFVRSFSSFFFFSVALFSVSWHNRIKYEHRKKCILYVCNGFNMKLVSGSKETSYCFLGILSGKT